MIRHLRSRVLSLLRFPSHLPAAHLAPLHSLLSTTASISPKSFSVKDFLVTDCGLTREQAIKTTKRVSYPTSLSRPAAALAFLSARGVPRSAIAAAVAADPRILSASVGRVLAPRFAELTEIGLSPSQIVDILSMRRTGSLRGNLLFWIQTLGTYDKLLPLAKSNCDLLSTSLEKVIKPNLNTLRECGVSASDIAGGSMYSSRLFTVKHQVLMGAIARVEELGVERGSGVFPRALAALSFLSKDILDGKIQLLRKLGFSQDELVMILKKAPQVLALSEKKIQRAVEFLMRDVSLQAPYIARRPTLIMYSLEKRLMPRHSLLEVLRHKGLLGVERDYYTIAVMTEKKFVHKFVDPYKSSFPGLADDYASACLGKA
jgi:mTERF domain-containing protein